MPLFPRRIALATSSRQDRYSQRRHIKQPVEGGLESLEPRLLFSGTAFNPLSLAVPEGPAIRVDAIDGVNSQEFASFSSSALASVGISQRAIDYINALESDWTSLVLNDAALQNTVDALAANPSVPANAELITDESQFDQIVSGGTYLIQGDLTVAGTFNVPSNVTIYVDGSIFKQGSFVSPNGVHDLENRDDAIFMVQDSDNVQLIGINNALLHSSASLDVNTPHATAVIVKGNANDVLVQGFEIANAWEGVLAYSGSSNVTIQNNYIHDVLGRAIWLLGTTNTVAAHNFIENPGMDGIDFDAYTADSTAYENVMIGAGRWAGFVEEGANNNYLVRGMAIMADFGNPNSGYQMGWADNGTGPIFTAQNPGLFTRDNYFIDNVVFRPTSGFADGGEYFAKTGPDTEKGPTYFWANRGYGAGQSQTLFQNAEWLGHVPTAGGVGGVVNGVQILADLDNLHSGQPVAVDDAVATHENMPVVIDVLANDTDPNGDTLSLVPTQTFVADYADDFQTGTVPSGWQYLWNANGEFGDTSSYDDLIWDTWRYRPTSGNFPYLGSGSGHPGNGADEAASGGIDRYAIAAYTVQQDGVYAITDSTISRGGQYGDGVQVAAHVSGGAVSQLLQVDPQGGGSFDTSLGFLSAGQTIYVAVGPDGPGAGSANANDAVAWDFSLVRTGDPANGNLTLNPDQTITYTPNPGFVGTDRFTYKISDGNVGIASANVVVDVTPAPIAGPQLAAGLLNNISTNAWTTVNLSGDYNAMVVVATPVFTAGQAPLVTRITNITSNSFDVMIQRADGSAADVSGVQVQYVVAEAGVYTQAEHGITLEAVAFNSTITAENNSWVGQARAYQGSYSSPVVLGQVMSYNDARWSTFWSQGASRTSAPTASSLTVGKHVGEDPDTSRADETIGYLVIEAGSGEIDGLKFSAGLGSDIVRGTQNGGTYNYTASGLNSVTSAVLSMAGVDGGDGGFAVINGSANSTGNTLATFVDEDTFRDAERSHTTEQVAWFAFEQPAAPLASDDVAATNMDTAVVIDVLGNDTDPNNDPLSIAGFTQAANGTVTDNGDGTLTYTPNAGYLGPDSFTYQVADGVTGTDSATVQISVNSPSAWTALAYEDFESGFGTYTDGGNDAILYTGSTHAHQGSNAANLQDNSGVNSSITLTDPLALNSGGYTSLKIEFWFKAVSFENNEDFLLQFYDGSSWQTLRNWTVGSDFANNDFNFASVEISSLDYNFTDNAQIRLQADASGNGDDVYIDEVTISAK